MERGKQFYNTQYDKWVPWLEDQYLYYFTKDNKASYATKQQLDKTQVTGVEPVDKLQGGVTDTVAGQVGQGGLLQPVGDMASKEGANRAERGGKDDKGSYGGPLGGVTDPLANKAKEGGSAVTEGAKGAGGYLGGWFGGKKEEKK
ncbi:hypothetical protein C1H76_0055 [Elsinoe australis]|uniref:Uncharacterized protein n=1 Tax=Elsinoe australis TaxID=40998 RepID=A0A4U7BBS9_9PEZI|nr:hypothetical protein C1H76_0055 [Elsinoe australis]